MLHLPSNVRGVSGRLCAQLLLFGPIEDGVSGVLVALLLTPDGNELPTVLAILLALRDATGESAQLFLRRADERELGAILPVWSRWATLASGPTCVARSEGAPTIMS